MFYPNQLILIPKSYADSNKSRFIKMDGSSVDKNIIPKEIESLSIFECINEDNSCIPYYNENSKVYDVLGENTINEEYAFSNNDKCMTTAIPGECSVVLLLKNKRTKLTFTGIDISVSKDTFDKYGIYPKEIQIFGYDDNKWIPLTGLTHIRDIDPETNDGDLIKLDWMHKVNQMIPCNGFKLTIFKWSKLVVNVNPGIKNIKFNFKEDRNTVKTVNIECPENYVYCFDLVSYIKSNVNSNECALENKIVSLIKKHIKFPEIESDADTENYVADLSMFYNKHIKEFRDRLEDVESRESRGEMKIIEVSENDKNTLQCEQALFQEIIVMGNNLPDKSVSIVLPKKPSNGDSIKIIAMRKDMGQTIIHTGPEYKAIIGINGAVGEGHDITLVKYGSFVNLIFFKNMWLGTIS